MIACCLANHEIPTHSDPHTYTHCGIKSMQAFYIRWIEMEEIEFAVGECGREGDGKRECRPWHKSPLLELPLVY